MGDIPLWVIRDPLKDISYPGPECLMYERVVPEYRVPNDKVFPSWVWRDDADHHNGSGPFFIARKTSSSSAVSVYDGYRRRDTNLGLPGERQWQRTLSGVLHTTFGYTEFGLVAGEMCLYSVAATSNGSSISSTSWFVVPCRQIAGNPSGDQRLWLQAYYARWNPPIPSAYLDPKNPKLAADWLRAHIDSYVNWSANSESRWIWSGLTQEQGGGHASLDEIGLKYGEYQYWTSQVYGLSPTFSGSRSLHAGNFSLAFREASAGLPALHQNTIMNILETVDTIRSLLDGFDASDLRKVRRFGARGLKDLGSDLWLRYRYQYNTTVSDLTELTNAIMRLEDIISDEFDITSYGRKSDSTGNYHCALCTSSRDLSASWSLRTTGLAPSLANIWDMIPFSFMVDWFAQISTVLEAIDDWLYQPTIAKSVQWYSFTNHYVDDSGAIVSVFFRFQGGKPLLPVWEYSDSSSRTWAMRITDLVALFI